MMGREVLQGCQRGFVAFFFFLGGAGGWGRLICLVLFVVGFSFRFSPQPIWGIVCEQTDAGS